MASRAEVQSFVGGMDVDCSISLTATHFTALRAIIGSLKGRSGGTHRMPQCA
jgi:hypothetical protein